MNAPWTIATAASAMRRSELSSVELVTDMIDQSARLDPLLGVFLHCDPDTALANAERADAALSQGLNHGALHGIPLGIKDVIATNDAPTTAQSAVLSGGSPSLWFDADSVGRLRAAGAVILGKTTTMEFAKGRPVENEGDDSPVPRNPWNPDCWTGGSSSGTANGIAAGLFLGGLGTDTGGSVRLPAAFCGITGFKPSYGKVSLHGVIPLATSMDHVGPMARSVRDCGILFSAISTDSTDQGVDWVADAAGPASLAGIRIGVDRENHLNDPRVDDSLKRRFEQALEVLVDLGAEVTEVTIPCFDDLVAASNIVSLVEAFTYHRINLQRHPEKYWSSTRRTLVSGAAYLASDYARALQTIRYSRNRVSDFMTGLDALVMPTTSRPADRFGHLNDDNLIPRPQYTRPWNAIGFPALSVPMGLSDHDLPVGLQMVAKLGDDQSLLGVGAAFQAVTQHHLQVPALVHDGVKPGRAGAANHD